MRRETTSAIPLNSPQMVKLWKEEEIVENDEEHDDDESLMMMTTMMTTTLSCVKLDSF